MLENIIEMQEIILVTGANGYVGGRLIPLLLTKGYHVRALARNLSKMKEKSWANHDGVELIACNVNDFASLSRAFKGVTAAYYLIHSMAWEEKDFPNADRIAALTFVSAAESASVERIIYLSGLGNEKDKLSRHLSSRKEVAEIFRRCSIPATIFRAAMIIGSGSASFEILRYLVDRLPLMITPNWVRTPCQPISIINALEYLVLALEIKETIGQTFDIGGPRITSYQELMEIYAKEANLRHRKVISVPILSPKLSSYWIGLVTPIPAALGKPLVEGLSNKVICEDERIKSIIPQNLLDYDEAIRISIKNLHIPSKNREVLPHVEWANPNDPTWAGGTLFEEKKEREIEASEESVWKTVLSMRDKKGWFSNLFLWKQNAGNANTFWHVKKIDFLHKLSADWQMRDCCAKNLMEQKKSLLILYVRFAPKGLLGIFYWYSFFLFRKLIFWRMLRAIRKEAIQREEDQDFSHH